MSDEEILRAVKLTFGPATASEISEEVGLNNSGANKRLNELADGGFVHKKKVGAKAAVYWLTDDGENILQGDSEA